MGKYFTQIKEKTKQFTKKEWTIVAIVIALIIALAGFGIYKGLTPSNKKQGWFTTEQGTMYYVDGKEVTGWLNDEETSNKYYFDENGIMQTGFIELDKSTYYFDKEDGHMLTGWQTIENKKYYFEDNGKMKIGICKVGDDTYCFENGAMVTGEKEIDGVTYDFGTDGKMKLKEGETSVEVKQDDQGNTVIEIKKEDGSTVENVVSASSSINQAPADAKVETPVSNNTQTTTKPSSGSSSSNNSNASSSSSNTSTTKPSGNNSSSNNNTNNNNSSNSNTSSSSKPSGGNNNASSSTTPPSGTGSNSGSNSSSGSNSGSNSGSTTPSTPSHTHNWVAVTKTVHHDEVGHNETYQELVKEAWDEEVPIYEESERSICNQCGADITNHIDEHFKANWNCSGYHSEWQDVQVGTNKIHHDAEYVTKTRYVVDKAAYDETVVTGYKCSECGQTK